MKNKRRIVRWIPHYDNGAVMKYLPLLLVATVHLVDPAVAHVRVSLERPVTNMRTLRAPDLKVALLLGN